MMHGRKLEICKFSMVYRVDTISSKLALMLNYKILDSEILLYLKL
jgi:hypothetical protein